MRLKVDENLPQEVAGMLNAAGHDALSVLDQSMGGHPDHDLAAACQAEERTILSLDLHFADIRHYPPREHAGLIVLRLPSQDKSAILDAVGNLIPFLDREPIKGRLWIMDGWSLRIRPGRED